MKRTLILLVLPLTFGCSSYDLEELDQDERPFVTLREAWGGRTDGASVLVAPPVLGSGTSASDEETTSGPMRFDAQAFLPELTRALGEVFERVELARETTPERIRREAWEAGLDYVLTVNVLRWDAEFVETNGWWWPNAFFVGWYFWPIGPQWWIADEDYGVDLLLELRLERAASETPLPGLAQRPIKVRTVEAPDVVDDAQVVAAPRLALDDLDRGLDLFGTWISGSLNHDQWEQVGELMAPYARRTAAIRVAAAAADGVHAFTSLSPEAKAEALTELATTHALVVGVSDYEGERCVAAARDAELMSELLRSALAPLDASGEARAGKHRWAPEKNVVLLQNAEATPARIAAELAALRGRAEPQDTVVVYFAGRGEQTAPGADGMRLRTLGGAGSGIMLSELGKALRAVPARRRLVVLDTDFRAGPRGSTTSTHTPPVGAELVRLLRGELLEGASGGGVVLASNLQEDARAHTFTAEDDPQGLLTLFLLRALRGEADAGSDGLTAKDLERYLVRYVDNLSRVALEQRQRPLVVAKSDRLTSRIQ